MLGKWWLTMIRHEIWNVSMASVDRFCHSQVDHMPKSNQRQGTNFHCKFFRKNLTMWSGWWCNNHLEKYESQLGWLFPIYGKIYLKNVWNHQPVVLWGCGYGWRCGWLDSCPKKSPDPRVRCQHVPHVRKRRKIPWPLSSSTCQKIDHFWMILNVLSGCLRWASRKKLLMFNTIQLVNTQLWCSGAGSTMADGMCKTFSSQQRHS